MKTTDQRDLVNGDSPDDDKPIKYSVIIPAFNAERTIQRAISSALSQECVPNFEVVVCDDGSADATRRLVEDFGGSVTLVSKANGGLPSARNAAIAASSGEWLVLLDADDEWLPNRLTAIDHVIRTTPDIGIVTTDAIVRSVGRPDSRYYEHKEFPQDEQRTAILRDCFIFVSAAFRRTTFDRLGGFDESHRDNSEYEFWIRAILLGERAALAESPLAIYHRSQQTMSADRSRSWRRVMAHLQWAMDDGGLTGEEVSVAKTAHDEALALALVAEAMTALRTGSSDARMRCLRVARSRARRSLRIKFLMAAASPRLAVGRLRL